MRYRLQIASIDERPDSGSGTRGPAARPAQFLSRKAATVLFRGNGGKVMMVHLSAVGAMGVVATCEFVSQVLHAFRTLW